MKKQKKETKSETKPKKEASKKKIQETLENEINELKTQMESLVEAEKKAKEQALLHMAELENFKKRKNQEVDTFKKFAAENVINAFLPVIDNFSIACTHAETTEEAKSDIVQGFILIQKQIDSTLEKLNITTIDALNKAFDPNLHQAIGREKQDNTETDIVIKEVQKGFKLHEKIIRPAMVIVSE